MRSAPNGHRKSPTQDAPAQAGGVTPHGHGTSLWGNILAQASSTALHGRGPLLQRKILARSGSMILHGCFAHPSLLHDIPESTLPAAPPGALSSLPASVGGACNVPIAVLTSRLVYNCLKSIKSLQGFITLMAASSPREASSVINLPTHSHVFKSRVVPSVIHSLCFLDYVSRASKVCSLYLIPCFFNRGIHILIRHMLPHFFFPGGIFYSQKRGGSRPTGFLHHLPQLYPLLHWDSTAFSDVFRSPTCYWQQFPLLCSYSHHSLQPYRL